MASIKAPVRGLIGEGLGHYLVIGDGQSLLVDCGEAGTMGEEFRKSDPLLVRCREFRPEVGDAGGEGDSLLLQRVKSDSGSDPLAG